MMFADSGGNNLFTDIHYLLFTKTFASGGSKPPPYGFVCFLTVVEANAAFGRPPYC